MKFTTEEYEDISAWDDFVKSNLDEQQQKIFHATAVFNLKKFGAGKNFHKACCKHLLKLLPKNVILPSGETIALNDMVEDVHRQQESNLR